MQQDRESQVRQRAHAIWLEEGMPEGQSEAHWDRAQSEIEADAANAAPAPASETAEPETAAPAVGTEPEFQNPDPAPVPPDVEAITDPATARAPSAAKKQPRRKVKPVTPVR
ncbi:DUF2934 domain-containing protein [Sphingomonas sp. GC_Shp_3]|uniref:DUF2934 domain-containing protein n=1 Tax=Sphingomonas sp. GC_Shp_3 TaxID=2937383 RepID=UPI00226AD677|nr:DUF2934 domain-containing protein [Sphingomonas sp. GC_Shp_3]